jgi:hypothetical protein
MIWVYMKEQLRLKFSSWFSSGSAAHQVRRESGIAGENSEYWAQAGKASLASSNASNRIICEPHAAPAQLSMERCKRRIQNTSSTCHSSTRDRIWWFGTKVVLSSTWPVVGLVLCSLNHFSMSERSYLQRGAVNRAVKLICVIKG